MLTPEKKIDNNCLGEVNVRHFFLAPNSWNLGSIYCGQNFEGMKTSSNTDVPQGFKPAPPYFPNGSLHSKYRVLYVGIQELAQLWKGEKGKLIRAPYYFRSIP